MNMPFIPQPSPFPWRTCIFLLVGCLLMLAIFAPMCLGAEYSDEQIVNAIYRAEGGATAKVPYGILSVKVKDEAEARRVCFNTIRNNRRRYAEWGYKTYGTYLEFLASRYCPVGAANDPRGLNKNWLRNVTWWLKNGKKRIQQNLAS